MAARIFSTLLLWTLTIAAIIYAGTLGWSVILWLLAAGAAFEACALCRKMSLAPKCAWIQISCFVIMLGGWITSEYLSVSGVIMATAVCCLLLLTLLKSPFDTYWNKSLLPTMLLILAIPFMLQWLVFLSVKCGVMFSVMILAAAKFSDVGAFVFGKGIGRHKLSPSISPKKTWEGAIGGIFSSAAISAAIAWACYGTSLMPKDFLPTQAIWIGALIGATAIVSDLIESVFKRRANIKDSGAIIPGIGGMLDLADSILLSAPLGAIIAITLNLNA